MVTSFTVNPGGDFSGTLDIDIGTLLGIQKIEIEGDAGSKLVAYVGDATDLDAEARRALLATALQRIVPMAQTFEINEDRYVAGVDLKLITKDASAGDVIVQIRKTSSGIPTDEVLAESIKAYADLTEDAWNSWAFPPLLLRKDITYAICLITESTDHAFGIAQLGGIDSISGDAVTKQSFQRGNLHTSSDGVSYSVHQNTDLMFRLKGCAFSPTTKEINLGDITGTNVSDLAILGGIELPSRDCTLDFTLTDPDDAEYTLDKDQVLTLASKKTGTFNLKANLTGTSKLSPVLFNNTQIAHGEVASSANYYSRMLETPTTWDLTVKVEFKKRGNGAIAVKAVESDGASGSQETTVTLQGGTQLMSDGWEYRIYKVSGLTAYTSGSISGGQVKIEATGGVADRPYMRNIVATISDGS